MSKLMYLVVGLAGLAFVGIMFFAVVVAAAFVGKGGGPTADEGGNLSGDCDYKKIMNQASGGRSQGESIIKGKLGGRETRKPPSKFVPIYEKTSEKKRLGGCGPSILAAIHSIETNFADTGYSVVNGAGAGGPWQFLQGSWAGFAGDCNEGGSRSWPAYSVENGACAAANHLRGPTKAPKNWYEGIHSYNRADWYVYAVAGLAEKYASAGDRT